MSESQIEQLNDFQEMPLPFGMQDMFSDRLKSAIHSMDWKPIIVQEQNSIYLKKNSDDFTIGDICVTFGYVPCDQISVIGAQDGKTFKPFNMKEKWRRESKGCRHSCTEGINSCCLKMFCSSKCCGGFSKSELESIDWVSGQGNTKEEMVSAQAEEISSIIIIVRSLGVIILMLGFFMLIGPLGRFAGIIRLLDHDTVLAYALFSGLMGVSISMLIIGFVWLYYRKGLALGLWFASLAILGYIWGFGIHYTNDEGTLSDLFIEM